MFLQSRHDCDLGPTVQIAQLQTRNHRIVEVFFDDASFVIFCESGGVHSVSRLVQVHEGEPIQLVVNSWQDGIDESIVVGHASPMHVDSGWGSTDTEDGLLKTRYG